MSELVTGEAVVLELAIARPATRAIALGIDLLLETIAFLVLLVPIAFVVGDDASESLIAGLAVACSVMTFVGYNTAMETLTRGKTVGKYALGLRVVRDDGGPVHFRQAFVRALCGVFVDFLVTSGCVGFLTAMLNARGKRVGDMLAGTVVLRERGPRAPNPLPPVPAELAAWAARAELSRVPDQLALSARNYLGRYYDLAPPARDALGARLASAVAEYVSPSPPPGVPAWAYLAAILGERRNRAFARQQPHQTSQPHETQPHQTSQELWPQLTGESSQAPGPQGRGPSAGHPGSGDHTGIPANDPAERGFAPPS
ncbi:RDD family protein [Actinopolymorpha sp. B9G3]|uniref:RDD family protein n=1 Tax=Actinopolymorpha sp. B9G3 TaxID=3158970 RepID=UPI0032D926C0